VDVKPGGFFPEDGDGALASDEGPAFKERAHGTAAFTYSLDQLVPKRARALAGRGIAGAAAEPPVEPMEHTAQRMYTITDIHRYREPCVGRLVGKEDAPAATDRVMRDSVELVFSSSEFEPYAHNPVRRAGGERIQEAYERLVRAALEDLVLRPADTAAVSL